MNKYIHVLVLESMRTAYCGGTASQSPKTHYKWMSGLMPICMKEETYAMCWMAYKAWMPYSNWNNCSHDILETRAGPEIKTIIKKDEY